MQRFEYEITTHAAETFSELVYYCTEAGSCALKDVPPAQLEVLAGILNERGNLGWELVQLAAGKDGVVAFWKRPLAA